MDPNKKPSFPGLPGATRLPWQQQLGRGLPTEEPGPVGRARGLPFLTEGPGIGRARSFPPPAGDSPLPMQMGRGVPLPAAVAPAQIGRGAPLLTGDLPVQIGRGAPLHAGGVLPGQFGRGSPLPIDSLPVQIGRGDPLPSSALSMQIGRGSGPLPADSLPVQIGRGLPLLHAAAPPVQIGRGAPIGADAVPGQIGRGAPLGATAAPMQIGRGAPLPTDLPVQIGRGAPLGGDAAPVQIGRGGPLATEPPVGFARGIPAGVKTTSGDVPTPGRGSGLVAMFRGMGIEPLQTSWGRGGPPVGRGEATLYLGAEVKEQAAPVGVVSGPGQPEEVVGRGVSFLGRGLMPGVGRAAMPQLGVGRGPTQVLSPGPIAPKAPDVPPPPIPQPSVYTDAPDDSASVTLSEDSSTPDDPAQLLTKAELKMEATREPLNKMGSKGTVVTVGSNQIPICCKNEAVYQYHVTFKPNVESIAMRFGMLRDHRPTTGEVVAFDGSILYLPVKMEKVVLLKSERRTDNQEITIKIEMTKILPPHSDLCIPFYNVVLRRLMKIVGLKLVGRNHYDPQSAVILGKHRLQIWPGYSTSIKHTDGGLYLSVDVTHKVLRNDSVLNVMTAFYQQSTQSFQDDCTKELLGAIVITRYNNRTYRIDDIKWDKSPKDTFTMADGSQTSFVEYYSKNYGITIKEMDQPMLVHRPKERSKPGGKQILTGEILLVPELAFMTGIPDKMRQDFRAMKDLTIHINVSADQHTQSIKQLLKNINSNPEALTELARWGLGIGTEILMTQGRTLPMETVCLQTASFVTGPDVSWSREVTREAVISCVPMNLWAIFYPRRAAEQAEELVSTFLKVAKPMGISLQKPVRVELRDDRTETYVKTIHSHLTSEPNVQLIVAIITGNRDDLYSAIKKLCCIQRPVPSQCINARTISQPQKLRSVAQKILLQMNCKLGGALWTVNVPLKQLMVIGVDVNHDTSKKKQSVMGFVASLNSLMTQWYSRVIFQTATEEIISGFRMCFLAALQKFYEINHSLPEKIVVFRDGVGDGQLNAVEHYEIPQLLKCFETFPNYEPKMTFLVVQKRISTTLYSISGSHFGTPPPGTVLDHTVTHRDWVDFYLMAHTIRQGCGLPTHYVCVYNTANLAPDHLQRLTFKMCHLYWNWPGTVRVPAPCRYAHKLAFLAGQHLHAEPSIQLADKLYFL